MHPSRPVLLALLLSAPCLSDAVAGEPTRYLELVNRARDSVMSMAMAPTGSDAFQDVPMPVPLRGGGEAVTMEVARDACRYDLRFTFRDGRSALYQDIDLCRHRGLRIHPLPRNATDARRKIAQAAIDAGS